MRGGWVSIATLLAVACASPSDPPAIPHLSQPIETRYPELRGRVLSADRLPAAIEPTDARYRIRPCDRVQALPPGGAALLRVRIDRDGKSVRLGDSLPVDVNWAGRTIAEVKAEVQARFPAQGPMRVHVRPHEGCAADAHAVRVVGESAVEVPWSAGLRLIDALDLARCVPPAHASDAWILRRGDGTFIHADLWALFASADRRHDPILEPTDIVVVGPKESFDDARWRLMMAWMDELP